MIVLYTADLVAEMPERIRLIIDTDPGIDDAMAIASAFNSPEVEVIGLTSTFGNVQTAKATENAHFLCKLAGREEVTDPATCCNPNSQPTKTCQAECG